VEQLTSRPALFLASNWGKGAKVERSEFAKSILLFCLLFANQMATKLPDGGAPIA
jgi:hypothetical protein